MSAALPDAGATGQDVRVGRLRIHVARPQRPSTAGVLLYPTIMGLNPVMRVLAASIADASMTAVVWDPYDGEDGNGQVVAMLDRSRGLEDEAMVADLRLVVDHMRDELGVTAIGGVGWCFGGRVGLVHAGGDDRIGALSAYNPTIYSPTPVDIEDVGPMSRDDFPGQTLDEFALAGSIRGPVQVCRPERDFTQPAEYERLVDALSARPDPTLYDYYPGATHGFSYIPGEANERAHRLAWASTLSLFSTTLLEVPR
jgi:carboxymethylenebutenolidase